MMSPAAAAKARERKRVLPSSFDDVGDDADWQPQRRRSKKQRCAVTTGGAVITGGKATKTGMVLARAQLTTSPSGVVAAQERQAALLGKGKYRKAEDLAREAPVGSLATNTMPKHKGNGGSDKHFQKSFGQWMRTAFKAKARLGHRSVRALAC